MAVTGTKKPRGKPRSMENRLYNRVVSSMRIARRARHRSAQVVAGHDPVAPTRRPVRPRRTSHRRAHQPPLTRPTTRPASPRTDHLFGRASSVNLVVFENRTVATYISGTETAAADLHHFVGLTRRRRNDQLLRTSGAS